MSLIPEFIFQTMIVRGIKVMRNDARFIDQLFRNLDQKSIAEMREFIKTQAIDLCINYPRTTMKVPAIVILLKNETEGQAFLGDSMGVDQPEEFSYDGGIEGEVLGGTATESTLDGNATVVFGPAQVVTATENTIRIGTSSWQLDQYADGKHNVRIVAGTGAGQIRGVTGNGRNVIMIEGRWLKIPDSTSKIEVTRVASPLLGEPSSLYNRRGDEDPLERRGGLYNTSYQIQVIGPNPELTIFLQVALKAIFTLSRIELERQGIINFKMGATDFAPRAEYVPDFAYMRAINIDFTNPFDVFESIAVAREIRMALFCGDDDGGGYTPISDTTFPITRQGPADPVMVSNPLDGAQRVYYGALTPPGIIDAAWVQNSLADKGTAIAGKRQRVINVVAGAGEKFYYAYPSRFGGAPSNFIDAGTGVVVGMTLLATLPITTSLGDELFYVWGSNAAGLGTLQVQVE